MKVGAFDVTIENPKGSERSGTDANGKKWSVKMNNTYGYIRGTEGVDGDHIDVFLAEDMDKWDGKYVFVVDQYNPDGSFDEHKVMLGFNNTEEARSAYLSNYEKGWENGRRIVVTAVNLDDFEKWIGSSKRKTKPFGEYSSVKKDIVEINAPANEDTPSEIQTLLRERGCTPISQEHRNLTDEGIVADNAGNPIILYHGTLDKSISVSELEAGHKRADGESADFAGSGVYFTPNKDVAEEYGHNGQVFEAHVKLSNPFYMLSDPGFNESEAIQFSNLLKSKGYDGIIHYMNAWSVEHNMIDGGEVVVFNNSSILPIEKRQNNHAANSITPSTYTNKKGKTSNVSKKGKPRISKENEVKRTVEHFPMETTEEAAAFDKRVPEMKDSELLAYMQEDGKGDINSAYHMNIYDEYDYRHTDEQTEAYNTYIQQLHDSNTTLEQAEEMLGNILGDVERFATDERSQLIGQSDALQDYITELERQKENERAEAENSAEVALRDAIADLMRKSGLDVLGHEVGQRVLDEANGRYVR